MCPLYLPCTIAVVQTCQIWVWLSMQVVYSDESCLPPHLQKLLPRHPQLPHHSLRRPLKCQVAMRRWCLLLPTPCPPGARRRLCSQWLGLASGCEWTPKRKRIWELWVWQPHQLPTLEFTKRYYLLIVRGCVANGTLCPILGRLCTGYYHDGDHHCHWSWHHLGLLLQEVSSFSFRLFWEEEGMDEGAQSQIKSLWLEGRKVLGRKISSRCRDLVLVFSRWPRTNLFHWCLYSSLKSVMR